MDLNEKNKRRINNNGGEGGGGEPEEQEDDEKKMDKFFALIRSFREARDRRRNELKEMEMGKNKNTMNMMMMMKTTTTKKRAKTEHEEGGQKSSWVPSFEWEDFSEEQVELRKAPLFPAPWNNNHHHHHEKSKKNDQKDDNETGLDLKLGL
ncbi:Protein NIM1-INTERACTING 1 [Camellia lanceoleosa]|uniref:Protein NIM1-INTERACTING 1 n=1 Tax=Camellia lanceoleosa TaxID=1840588 RepID=A0ACC0F6I5_9ERIC|nr:Protein NIM1-INTERACTING 1 [Camellia lanceoleosa]